MPKEIRLKKGLNINLLGEADKVYASIKPTDRYAVKPTDFHGLTPKLTVKTGDKVKAGSLLFVDKYNDVKKHYFLFGHFWVLLYIYKLGGFF